MKNVALHNLGCKVNSYEMDVVQQKLQEKGYKIVPFDTKADIYIVNTCSVTNIADRKSRQMLHRAKKCNPDAVVVAMGCYVQAGKADALLDDCIDLAIGNNRKKDIVEILEAYFAEKEEEEAGCFMSSKTLNHSTIIDIAHTKEYEEMTLQRTADHTRAYIKIQDGCNQFCTYCIIPYARGRVRSRNMQDIITEIRGLAEAGYQEVVLTGIHISSYGLDVDGQSHLSELICSIHEIDGIRRIRLGSLEPRIVTEEFAKRLAQLPKVCPHFHLSLQSGCDKILKAMNRRYDTKEFTEKVLLLRSCFDNPAITTDVIVGFPGESEEDFETTRDYLSHLALFEMHIFPYSKREGTRAASMRGQLSEAVKKERSRKLFELEREQSERFRKSFLGREVEILFEEEKEIDGKRCYVGHTREYVKAAVFTGEDLCNVILRAEAYDVKNGVLYVKK